MDICFFINVEDFLTSWWVYCSLNALEFYFERVLFFKILFHTISGNNVSMNWYAQMPLHTIIEIQMGVTGVQEKRYKLMETQSMSMSHLKLNCSSNIFPSFPFLRFLFFHWNDCTQSDNLNVLESCGYICSSWLMFLIVIAGTKYGEFPWEVFVA